MKTLLLFIFLCLFINAFAQLNGTKTIDPAGSGPDNYTSFSAAITALNSSGTTSGVVFRIASGTYTEGSPLLINISTNKPSSSATVTFKPASGATCTLNVGGQVTGTRYALAIGTTSNSVDYIILDGSNTDDGTTRDWTIKATAATYGIEPIDIYGDYCTVKNCIVDMNNGGYSGSGYGITFRDVTPTATYGTVLNCYVKGNNAIQVGRSTTGDVTGCLIKGNELHFLNRGVYVSRASTVTIEDNEMVGDAYNGYPTSTCYGVYCASPSGNTQDLIIQRNIIRDLGYNGATAGAQSLRVIAAAGPGTYRIRYNKIYNIENSTSSTTAHTTIAIAVSGTAGTNVIDIHNNFIAGFLDNDAVSRAGTNGTRGLWLSSGAIYTIYYNTIYIADSDRDYKITACLFVGSSSANVTSKNNIFYNANSSSNANAYSIYHSPAPTTCTSDYNVLYASAPSNAYVGFDGTADRTTLANWQDNTPYDDNSKSKAVTFTSSTDLHLSGGSVGDGDLAGTPISGYSTDIDGDARHATYPYMGADEAATPLPVELVGLSYKYSAGVVTLLWKTATEVNNYGFEIQRTGSRDQGTEKWDMIGFVQGNGNSNSEKSYSFADRNILSATKYIYRLKQIDTDGKFEYSNEIEVLTGVPEQYSLSQNYPNPFNPSTVISYQLATAGNVNLVIYDILGKEIAVLVNGKMDAGSHSVDFNASGLQSGIYFYQITVTGPDGNHLYSATNKMTLIK